MTKPHPLTCMMGENLHPADECLLEKVIEKIKECRYNNLDRYSEHLKMTTDPKRALRPQQQENN